MTQTPVTATRNPSRVLVDGRPHRNGVIIAASVAAGVLLSVLWSFEFVDSVIGDTVASGILGHDAKATAISGTAAGLLFAFVSGLAGTFTACNIAMLASIGPLGAAGSGSGDRLRLLLRPVGYLTLGMVSVAAVYGFIGVLLGDRLPQLSTDTAGGVPVRIIQSSVVFGIIGLALIYLGLAAIRTVPDVFADRPVARVVTLGALIGGFLIGRPYPLFNKLFHWAVDSGNPLYGSAAFVLQSLGNIVVVTALFALLVVVTRGRFISWLAADVRRSMVLSGALLIGLGVFTVVYWDVRVPAIFGFGWFPTMFYNH
ncbi:hypothetical protein F8271_19465 [Micromonospora sp. ALFpr18c]|uniref:hypothetical protein n=1 Tax=unclassified Micromonospora TaxID=2617518 RepID=UPI00124AF953|nr:hypothetical protein [Micromonospora sp. ALFpr18c]KAB1937305.1 hypothetical protein F8271_19465 [Micromonospora sp. ALFpr18c]